MASKTIKITLDEAAHEALRRGAEAQHREVGSFARYLLESSIEERRRGGESWAQLADVPPVESRKAR